MVPPTQQLDRQRGRKSFTSRTGRPRGRPRLSNRLGNYDMIEDKTTAANASESDAVVAEVGDKQDVIKDPADMQSNQQIDEADSVLSVEEESETLQPPEGTKPIPGFSKNSWPSWRQHFFKDWRENSSGKVYCVCKLCKVPRFYSASKQAFSNFSLHLERIHPVEWSSFMKSSPASSFKTQQSITSFATSTVIHSTRQSTLDRHLSRAFATGGLPLRFLRNEDFQQFLAVNSFFLTLPFIVLTNIIS